MSAVVTWLSDDTCPVCGDTLTDLPSADHLLGQECRACGWVVTWQLGENGGDR